MDAKTIYQNSVGAVVVVETDEGDGSGFFFRRGGWVLTNKHVIDDFQTVAVRTHDGKKAAARVLSWDREHDLAVLAVQDFGEVDHPILKIHNEAAVSVGDEIIAIGHPAECAEFALSKGVVSALARKKAHETGFLQMNLSVNWGNSGGPVLAACGGVIGVATQIVLRPDQVRIEGASLAVPVSTVRAFVESLEGKMAKAREEWWCCPSCGACVATAERWCVHCGKRQPPVADKSAEKTACSIASSERSDDAPTACTSCGTAVADGDKWCNNCGKRR